MHVTELCMQVCECVWRDVAEDPCRHNAKTSGPRGSPGTVNVKLFTHCPALPVRVYTGEETPPRPRREAGAPPAAGTETSCVKPSSLWHL